MDVTVLAESILQLLAAPAICGPVQEQKVICALVVLVLVCVPLAEPTMTAMDIVTTKMLIALMAVAANVPPVLVVIRLLAVSLLEYVVLRLVPAMFPNPVLVQVQPVQVIRFSHTELFVQLVL